MSEPARIGIIGGGWRTGAYLTAAAADPSRFSLTAALVRRDDAAHDLQHRWPGVRATTSEEEFFRGGFDYVIVCVSREAAAQFTARAVARGIPALCETPPAADLAQATRLYAAMGSAPVQVAEQYRFQPHHAARLALVRDGTIGTPRHARISAAHDYHAVSLMRGLLNVGFEDAVVVAAALDDTVVATLGRDGWAAGAGASTTRRIAARLSFDGAPPHGASDGPVGDYDFSDEQYRSPLRSRHVSIRGTAGEISDDTVRYLAGPEQPVQVPILRQQAGTDGDLEGHFLRGLTTGGRYVYRNPLAPARLTDDEIAVGTVLLKMNEYVRTGAAFYGLADANQDHYLGLLIHESERTGRPVRSTAQAWAGASSAAALAPGQ